MNTQTPQRQHRNAEAVLPFIGLTGGELTITITEWIDKQIDKHKCVVDMSCI